MPCCPLVDPLEVLASSLLCSPPSSLSQTISRNDGIKIAGNGFVKEEREEVIVISEAAAVAPIEQVTQITKQSDPPLEIDQMSPRSHDAQVTNLQTCATQTPNNGVDPSFT